MTITGVAGKLCWSYYTAATLSQWNVTKADGQWTLSATVESVDAFKVAQQPLTFVTPNAWRWPVSELQMMGASCTAVLGPKEGTHVQPVREASERPSAS